MEERLHNQEINSGTGNEGDLLLEQIADMRSGAASFALEKLRSGNRCCDIRLVSRHFSRYTNRRRVNGFGLRAISCTPQFFARPEECQSLQNFGAGMKKFAV